MPQGVFKRPLYTLKRRVRQRLERRVKGMSEVERAWVGAFIEADGAVSCQKARVVIEVVQSRTNVEPISALLRATGVGGVYYDRLRPASKSSLHHTRGGALRWAINAWNDVQGILIQCELYSEKCQRGLQHMTNLETEWRIKDEKY